MLSGTRLIIFDTQFQVVKVINETIFVNAYANGAVMIQQIDGNYVVSFVDAGL